MFTYPRRVSFADTDMAGIVHFSRFFAYMEEAEHALLRSLGLSVYHDLTAGEPISWPRVAASCDYKSPARFEDELSIDVVVAEVAVKAVTYRFTVRRGADTLAVGRIVAVCCTHGERDGRPALRSCPVPPAIAEKLRTHLAGDDP